MPAGREIETEEGVARIHQREEYRRVCRRAGMRLHVCEFAAEQSGDAVDRELLGDVDELAAAVIAPAGITFGIFVGQHRALRLEHGAADDIFRRDQLDLVALAAELAADRIRNFRIASLSVAVKRLARSAAAAEDADISNAPGCPERAD